MATNALGKTIGFIGSNHGRGTGRGIAFNEGLAVREGVSRCCNAEATWRITNSTASGESAQSRSSVESDVAPANAKSRTNS